MKVTDEIMKNRCVKILITTNVDGDVLEYVLQLLQSFKDYDARFYLAIIGNKLTREQFMNVNSLPNVEVFHSKWDNDRWISGGTEEDRAEKWLLELEGLIRPDIIHLNRLEDGNIPFKAPKIMVGHSCIYSWWYAVKNDPPPSRDGEYYSRVKAGLHKSDVLVAVSHHIHKEFSKIYGPHKNSHVIYNSRKIYEYKGTLEGKDPFILSVGNIWNEGKNMVQLNQIAPELNWPVVVAGEIRHPLTGQPANCENIRILSHLDVEEQKKFMSKASIYASMSMYESFGLPVLEAALSGCALVLSDIGAYRELWKDAAIFIPPDDPDAWIETLNEVSTNKNLRNRISKKSGQKALKYCSIRMAENYRNLYNLVLKKNRARAIQKEKNEAI